MDIRISKTAATAILLQYSNLLLFENALIFDGSGSEPLIGSLLARDGRIAEIGASLQVGDAERVNCSGLALSPGIVDLHSHSDLQVLRNDRAKTLQGVTSEVVGNCGFSAFPCGSRPEEVQEYAGDILFGNGQSWSWDNASEYLSQAHQDAQYCHVETLVGHGTLRTAFAGAKQGNLAHSELDAMEGSLAECLSGGALGFSTGLMYAPGSSAPREELVRLCHTTARLGKVYATHMRSYGDHLLEAVEEQLSLAAETGCRLQLSHLQAVGRRNWDKQSRVLDRLEKARREGIDVAFDSYPYLAGSTLLTQLLPQWALEGGTPALLERLTNPPIRAEMRLEMQQSMPQQWSDIIIASVRSQERQYLVGKSIASLAQEAGQDSAEFMMDLLLQEGAKVNIVSFNQSDTNLRELLTHPLCTVISDGFYVSGKPHPRLYGTFPSLLGDISRDRQWMPLADAIHRVTARPAERFGLKERGRLQKGFIADLLLFDPAVISSRATYEDPSATPMGIVGVYRSGKRIVPV